MLTKEIHYGVSPQNVTNKDQNAEDHHQRIILNISGLDEAYRPADGLYEAADQTDNAVHDPAVPPARAKSALDRTPCRAVHSAVDDLCVKLPQIFAGVLRAIHEQRIVKLVDVPLVQQPAI